MVGGLESLLAAGLVPCRNAETISCPPLLIPRVGTGTVFTLKTQHCWKLSTGSSAWKLLQAAQGHGWMGFAATWSSGKVSLPMAQDYL